MRWKVEKHFDNEQMYKKSFAWRPVECISDDNGETEMVWLEGFYREWKWREQRWKFHLKYCKQYTTGEFTRRKLTGTLEPKKEPVPQQTYAYVPAQGLYQYAAGNSQVGALQQAANYYQGQCVSVSNGSGPIQVPK